MHYIPLHGQERAFKDQCMGSIRTFMPARASLCSFESPHDKVYKVPWLWAHKAAAHPWKVEHGWARIKKTRMIRPLAQHWSGHTCH